MAYEDWETGILNGGGAGGGFNDFGWNGTGVVTGPSISMQPVNTLASIGGTVSFSITAFNGLTPLTYQWQKNHVNLTNTGEFSGVTTSTLTITGVISGDYDIYRCVVTDAQGLSSTSNDASLTDVVTDWVNRVVANGGATPSLLTQNAMSAFYTGLSTDGLVSSMIVVNCFVPDSLVACLTPLIRGPGADPWTNVGFVGGDLSVFGLQGVGTNAKYLLTGAGVHAMFPGSPSYNAGSSFYEISGTTGCVYGAIDGGFANGFMNFPIPGASASIAYCWQFSDGATYTLPDHGFISVNRSAANVMDIWFANPSHPFSSLIHQTITDSGNPASITEQMVVFNGDQARLSWPSNHKISFGSFHTALNATQSQNFYNRVQTLRNTLGFGVTVANVAVPLGSNAVFPAVVTGGNPTLTYQWQKNNVNLVDGGNISGSTTANLTVSGVGAGDLANYRVIVTDGIGLVVTSNEATLVDIIADWAARVVTNGGASPSVGTKNALTTFVDGLVTDGLLSKMKAICCLVPDSLTAALTPLIVGGGNDPWTNNGFVSGDLTVNGLIGNGTSKYLDTGLNPSLIYSSPVSAGLTVYVSGNVTGVTECDFGSFPSGTFPSAAVMALYPNYSNVSYLDCFGQSTGRISAATSGFTGYHSGNCGVLGGGVTEVIYRANSVVGHTTLVSSTSAASQTSPNAHMLAFAQLVGASAAQWSAKRNSFFALHLGLTATDSSNFYNRIQKLRVDLGGGYTNAPTLGTISDVITVDGTNATFTAVPANGTSPYTYQWQKNDVNLSNGGSISGATTAVLTVTGISSSDYANYRCVVSDAFGATVTSNEAKLTHMVTDWATRVVSNGGAAPTPGTKTSLTTFANGLQADGILTKMKTVNCLVPDSLKACLTPLIVGPGSGLWTQTAGTAFTDANATINGFTGITGGALNTGFNASSVFSGSPLSAGMSLYAYSSTANVPTFGGDDSASGRVMVIQNNVQWSCWSYTDQIYTAVTKNGFCSGSRTAANATKLYFANSSTAFAQLLSTVTTNTSTPPNVSLYFMGYNQAGSTIAASDSTASFCAIHLGLSSAETQSLYNRVQQLRRDLGGGYVTGGPSLTIVPDQVVASGGNASFAVTASGGTAPYTYQWQKNDVNLINGGVVSGATTNTLSLTGVTSADIASYRCIVTDNAGNPTNSNEAALAVPANAIVISWLGRVVTNGGASVSAKTANAVDAFYSGLITDGIDTLMKSINCLVPDNLIAALTPLVVGGGSDPWTNHSFVSGDISINGLQGSNPGQKWLDTGLVDSSCWSSVNDVGMTIYVASASFETAFQFALLSADQTTGALIRVNTNSGNLAYFYSEDADITGASIGNGYYSGNRTASNATALYAAASGHTHSAIASGAGATTHAFRGAKLFLFTMSDGASPYASATYYSGTLISFCAFHRGLTAAQSSNFFSRIQTLRTALGGGFV